MKAEAQGLYDPRFEHDACGVAFVARLGVPPSHEVVSRALDKQPGTDRLLLIVDQWEELFTLCQDDAARETSSAVPLRPIDRCRIGYKARK